MEKLRKAMPLVVVFAFISYFIVYIILDQVSTNYYKKIVTYCYIGVFVFISVFYLSLMVYVIINRKDIKG